MKKLVQKIAKVFFLLLIFPLLMISCSEDDDADTIPPGEVTNLTATPGDGTVTLLWEPPADSDLKEYSVTYTPGGSILTVDGTKNAHTIAHLTNGAEYVFTIKTRDLNGNLSKGASVVASPGSNEQTGVVPVIGDVTIASASDLESFNANATYIDGSLIIEAQDIESLSAFSNLDSISGDLKIQFAESLSTLSGLENLTSVGASLVLWGNTGLSDLSALGNLKVIGKDIAIMLNDELESLDGLEGVQTVLGSIYVGTQAWKDPVKQGDNPKLGDFCALKNLLTNGISGHFYADFNLFNPTAQDIIAGNCSGTGNSASPRDVTNLSAVAGDGSITISWTKPNMENLLEYELSYNPGNVTAVIGSELEQYTVSGLSNGTEYTFLLKTVTQDGKKSTGVETAITAGSAIVDGNVQLGSQAEVDNFSSTVRVITGKLQIYGEDITDLSPLSNIDSVKGKVEVLQTTMLADLNGLDNLAYIGSNLYLESNAKLEDISALSKVSYIGKDVVILDCDRLTTLDGLEGLEKVEGAFYIGSEAWQEPPGERGNDLLSDFCALKSLFSRNVHNGGYYVANNANNPTKDEVISDCQ